MADLSLTDAVCRAVSTAHSIRWMTPRYTGKDCADLLWVQLCALREALKDSNTLTEAAATFRALYPAPVAAIGGVHAASYHEMGRTLAEKLLLGVCLVINPRCILDEAQLVPDADALTAKWPVVLACLRDYVQPFNESRLVALIQDEAARATPQAIGTATPPTAKPDEGEGNGGAGTAPTQPAIVSGATREAVLRKLEPADQRAYYTRGYAESNLGTTTDRQAYQWLSDNGLPDERDSPELAKALAGYTLPSFATWSKQVRNARKALGEQKHTRRAGRSPGTSVVPASDLDSQIDAD